MLKEALLHKELLTFEEQEELEKKIKDKVEFEWQRALNDPYPSEETILDNVYQ